MLPGEISKSFCINLVISRITKRFSGRSTEPMLRKMATAWGAFGSEAFHKRIV